MSKKEEQEFVVSDRRRFGAEGEVRTDVPAREEEPVAVPPSATQAPPASTQAASTQGVATQPGSTPRAAGSPAGTTEEAEEMPEPPTEAEQIEQHDAYKASGKTLDSLFQSKLGAQGAYPEMTFDKVIESLYMSALIQMGAIRQEGETQPQIDIIGARQTIDSLTVLQEKTKGNLDDREKTLMQNVLFELRMAWIELTNAIAARAANPPAGIMPEKK
jgi:hypothetical protein